MLFSSIFSHFRDQSQTKQKQESFTSTNQKFPTFFPGTPASKRKESLSSSSTQKLKRLFSNKTRYKATSFLSKTSSKQSFFQRQRTSVTETQLNETLASDVSTEVEASSDHGDLSSDSTTTNGNVDNFKANDMSVINCMIVTMIEKAREAKEAKSKLALEQHRLKYMVQKYHEVAEKNVSMQNELQHIMFVALPSERSSIFSAIGPVNHTMTYDDPAARLGPWALGPELGRGEFARVRRGMNVETQQDAAIKVISKESMDDITLLQKICHEVKAMRTYGTHPNIVGFLEYYHLNDGIYIIQELACGGDLFDYYSYRNVDRQTEREIKEVAFGLAQGLRYLHSIGICHRDLKAENVLLHGWTPGQRLSYDNIKIADFGFCAISNSLDFCPCHDLVGTPGFYPPEAVDVRPDKDYEHVYDGYKHDSWSLGCLLLEMAIGYEAFEDIWMTAYAGAGKRNPTKLEKDLPFALFRVLNDHLPQNDMGDFIKCLLTYHPSERPTVSQLLESHPWLYGFEKQSKKSSENARPLRF